jgi:hypothetical protein
MKHYTGGCLCGGLLFHDMNPMNAIKDDRFP